MQIEVKETHPPKAGKKVATVIAMDGQRYEIWPDKLAGIQVGRRYEVEVTEREYDGRKYFSIKKATPVNDASPIAGHAPAIATPSGEEYVGRVVAALILKGEIMPKEIAAYTARLRKVWRETDPDAVPYREAAE